MSLPGYLPDRGAAGQARLQWTTAQGDPPTGRHTKPYRNAWQLHHRRRARVTANSTWSSSHGESSPVRHQAGYMEAVHKAERVIQGSDRGGGFRIRWGLWDCQPNMP
jgi:hypothetical protein